MALVINFSFFAGDTKPVEMDIGGIDLTDCNIRWFLKTNKDNDDNLIVKESPDSITMIDAPTGKFSFLLSVAETSQLLGTYYHCIKIVDAYGNVTTLVTGTVSVTNGTVDLTYATVDEADAYFDDVLFAEAWTSASAETKLKALKMATKKIDMQPLIGRKADPSQPLEFPRALYSYTPLSYTRRYNPLIGTVRFNSGWVVEQEVAQCVKDATCEEAISILSTSKSSRKRAELQRQGVTSFSLGNLSESFGGSYQANVNALSSQTAAQLLLAYTGGSRVVT